MQDFTTSLKNMGSSFGISAGHTSLLTVLIIIALTAIILQIVLHRVVLCTFEKRARASHIL